MTGVADIHADIDALKEFRDALTEFRYAQREVAERGDHEIEATRASLEAKEGQWRSLLARREADLESMQAQQRNLADLVALSTIAVSLLGPDAAAPPAPKPADRRHSPSFVNGRPTALHPWKRPTYVAAQRRALNRRPKI